VALYCPNAHLRIHEPDVIMLSTDHNHEPRNDSGEADELQTTCDASSNGKRKRRSGQKKHRSSTEEAAVSSKDN